MLNLRSSLIAILFSFPIVAHAGLFDDDEARKQIKQLAEKVELQNKDNDTKFLKLDESIKNLGIIQLLNQIEMLNSELAKLRGQVEVLTNQNELLQKRQKDFYLDIDTRLRALEGNANPQAGSALSGINAPSSPPSGGFTVTPVSPVLSRPASATIPVVTSEAAQREREREDRAYDMGSAAFRRGDFTAAMRAFQTFITDFPQSQLVPNAIYWVGLSQFNLKDYREARATQDGLIKKYPDAGKVIADALLVIGSVQAELGDNGSARNTYEDIVTKYPTSDAAAKARTRLAGIRR
jgi:tol-pal system protein YbgF